MEKFSITIDINHIKLTLTIYDNISYLKEYAGYHWDDFQKDTLIGIVHLSEWLTLRNIRNKLEPDPQMNIIERISGYILLKIGKTAYNAMRNLRKTRNGYR